MLRERGVTPVDKRIYILHFKVRSFAWSSGWVQPVCEELAADSRKEVGV